ncbi:MAG: 4-hydroxy-tetrahydrodipicolinate synthase [Pseudorhodobacter sp.]|jgi:4-hydroxy-tetrahydrodipicolinate synthase
MNYSRKDAKSHAFKHLCGLWAATPVPFDADGAIDEAGFRTNLDHWTRGLGIANLLVADKEGECFSMTAAERMRCFDIAASMAEGRAQIIMCCTDQNLGVVLELAQHAQAAGGDYISVQAPLLPFQKAQDETLIRYCEAIAAKVDIGIVLRVHPDSGYLMSPRLCNRLADLETVVAITYCAPRALYRELHQIAADRVLIAATSEEEWLEHLIEVGSRTYLASTAALLMQTARDQRLREYTNAALAGDFDLARQISASLDYVREALLTDVPKEKPHAHQKYWQELLGQKGGSVRPPLLGLTEREKTRIRTAFEASGLLP